MNEVLVAYYNPIFEAPPVYVYSTFAIVAPPASLKETTD